MGPYLKSLINCPLPMNKFRLRICFTPSTTIYLSVFLVNFLFFGRRKIIFKGMIYIAFFIFITYLYMLIRSTYSYCENYESRLIVLVYCFFCYSPYEFFDSYEIYNLKETNDRIRFTASNITAYII